MSLNSHLLWTILKAISLHGIWAEVMGRVAEFNIAIILDPGQLTTYKNISKFKNKLNTEFNNYLDLIV